MLTGEVFRAERNGQQQGEQQQEPLHGGKRAESGRGSNAQLQDSSVPLDQRASPPLPRELKRKRVAALSALDAIHLSAASGAMRTSVHLVVPLDDRIAVITIRNIGVKTTARALVANYWSHLLSLFIRHDCRPFVVVCCMLCCCDSV